MVLYRKYRPQKLADLFGHEHIKNNLLSQLVSGKISHGYLFYGPKGSGKTSTARIIAKAVNCEKVHSSQLSVHGKEKSVNREHLTVNKFSEPCNKCLSCVSITEGSNVDLVEIDAASNRGIDEVRQLQERIKLSPISSRFKVYIIDEAHMLTTEAFNALLKTLEEPPSHVIFILCTTEVNRLPATIVSRLSRFNFRRAESRDLTKVLEKISKVEKIDIDREAIDKIVEAADGSFRDAVSILDQVSAKSGKINPKDVESLTSGMGFGQILKFVDFILSNNLKKSVLYVEDLAKSGGDISFFVKQTALFLEKVLFTKIGVRDVFEDLDDQQIEALEKLAKTFDQEGLTALMRSFLVAETEIKLYPLPQIPVVLAICKHIGEGASAEGIGDTRGIEDSEGNEEEKTLRLKSDSAFEENAEKTSQRIKVEHATSSKEVVKVAKGSKVTFTDIEKNWPTFLNKVKGVNLHIMALLRSTKIMDYDGTNLILEVFYRFHKDKLEEPKVIKMLEETISLVNSSDIRFKFILAKRDKVPKSVTQSNVVEIKDEDLAQIAAEIFSK